jgi:hypothetical protein
MNPLRSLPIAAALLLASCSTPVNPTLIADGQLAVATLSTIDTIAGNIPGVPASVTGLIGVALTGIQAGLTDLQSGAQTPASVAALIQTEIKTVAKPVATDLKANATIQNGLTLLSNLAPVIAADVGPVPTVNVTAEAAPHADPRAALAAWNAKPGPR